jgi:hypothetical protein
VTLTRPSARRTTVYDRETPPVEKRAAKVPKQDLAAARDLDETFHNSQRGEVGPIEAKRLEFGARDGPKPHAVVQLLVLFSALLVSSPIAVTGFPARALGDAKNKTPALPGFPGDAQTRRPPYPISRAVPKTRRPAHPVSRAGPKLRRPAHPVPRAVPIKIVLPK